MNDPSARQSRTARRRSHVRAAAGGKFGILLVALIALMMSTPLIVGSRVSIALVGLFTAAVLVASLHAARPGGKAVAFGFVLALTDFGIGRCAVSFGGRGLALLQAVLWLGTLIYVIVTILEAIFDSEEVTVETLQASLCVYLLLGLIGAFGFIFIELVLPGSFQGPGGAAIVWTDEHSRAKAYMRLVVFGFATLSGTSYSEVAPATGFASNAASLEAMAGNIYLAVVIARLVGIQSAPQVREEDRAR